MGGYVDNRSNNFNFNLFLNLGGQQSYVNTNALDSTNALSLLNSFFGADSIQSSPMMRDRAMPHCGCLPSPNINLSSAPAGQGLTRNEDGSITTAGGYKINASGHSSEWTITGPDGQNVSRVWGDPHVEEGDGTKWDFTKSSDFLLPDGTRIAAITNYDPAKGNGTGAVTTGLEIVNGADRASITGVNTGRPETTMRQDGYEFRALHLATDPNRDTFRLGAGKEAIQWQRERNGQIDGVVQHAPGKQVDAGGHRIYDQNVDNSQVHTNAHLRPPVGSRAWGNALRSELNDAQAQAWGQFIGPAGAWPALQTAYGIHGSHIEGQFQSDLRDMMFGGWPRCFPNFSSPFDALNGVIDLLRADNDWRNQFRYTQNAHQHLS